MSLFETAQSLQFSKLSTKSMNKVDKYPRPRTPAARPRHSVASLRDSTPLTPRTPKARKLTSGNPGRSAQGDTFGVGGFKTAGGASPRPTGNEGKAEPPATPFDFFATRFRSFLWHFYHRFLSPFCDTSDPRFCHPFATLSLAFCQHFATTKNPPISSA